MLNKVLKKEFWENIHNDSDYIGFLEEIKKAYCLIKTEKIEELGFYKRWKTHKTGERATFEKDYFQRRNFLSLSAILALAYPEEDNYIEDVNEYLWAICGEYSWVLPSHTDGLLENDFKCIDLFNAETGFLLSEVCYVLGDIVESPVKKRVDFELKRRIIEPFLSQKTIHWETGSSNWSSVCAGGVAAVLYYQAPELFGEYLPRIKGAMYDFTRSYYEDGTCIEGTSYYVYGMSFFAYCADMINEYTNGQINLFNDDKVKRMVGHLRRSRMINDTAVSFSDSSQKLGNSMALNYCLYHFLPEHAPLLPRRLTGLISGNVKWTHLIRTFEYYDKTIKSTEILKKDYYLEDAQQVIFNRENYSFAIKAGNNGEPHNHNDVGNFIFADKTGQVFCDLGAGLYTTQYFDLKYRYDILCCSSLGHNVPIVGEKAQEYGSECCGNMNFKNDIVTIDYSKAYKNEKLKRLVRTVIPNENGVVIYDEFESEESFIERLVTLRKPELHSGYVVVDKVKVSYNSDDFDVSVIEESHRTHNANEEPKIVYCIDFKLANNLKKAELNIECII